MEHRAIKIIRPARNDDIETLQELFGELTGHAVSAEDIRDRLSYVKNSPDNELYVCEDRGRVCGAMAFRIRENIEEASRYGEISLLVTGSRSRRRGIGRILMAWAEELAAEKGCKGTWLVSNLRREQDAHRFYRALGYEITGYRFVKPLDFKKTIV